MGRWFVRSIVASLLAVGLAPFALAPAAQAQDELELTKVDDWTLRCTRTQPPRCDLRQRVVNNEGKQIIDFGIGYDATTKNFPVVMELPLGILVQQQIRFKIDESVEFGGMKVNRCLPTGCIVDAVAPMEMIDAMRRGQKGAIIVPLPEGKFVALELSLRGFTASSAELIQRNSQN